MTKIDPRGLENGYEYFSGILYGYTYPDPGVGRYNLSIIFDEESYPRAALDRQLSGGLDQLLIGIPKPPPLCDHIGQVNQRQVYARCTKPQGHKGKHGVEWE